MSDPLLDFLLSRDREKVLAEARPVSLERLYAEASVEDRAVIDTMPTGVLRRRLLEAEQALALAKRPKVRVIGNPELLGALKRAQAKAESAEATCAQLREIQKRQAATIAALRNEKKEAA